MDIFIINAEKANQVPQDLLDNFSYKDFSDKEKAKIHKFSYLMLDRILKEFYQIENRSIIFDNKKPTLQVPQKEFSISHSDKTIVIGFSDSECGIDIEKIKNRNYEKISERMGFDSHSLKDFYINWTKYEAEYKLGCKAESVYNFEIPNYIITAVNKNKDEIFELYYNL